MAPNLLLFAAGGFLIWAAGTRLSGYAEALADRTGIGKAIIGGLLLGGITSLPEVVTTVTAAAIGNPQLAVNNILGGVAMQVAVLAVADALVPGRPITARTGQAVVLIEAALLILILTLTAAAVAVGDRLVFGVGMWSTAIFGSSLLAYGLIHEHASRQTWAPAAPRGDRRTSGERPGLNNPARSYSMRRLVITTAAAAAAILVGATIVAHTGDALADQTGLGASFVGMIFLAAATSLPEISTTIAAVRLGQFVMGFSNIFGANILDLSILFLADVASPGGPILHGVGEFSLLAALLGILLTAVYMVGLIDRRKRLVLGMGLDSLVVLMLYVSGVFYLFTRR